MEAMKNETQELLILETRLKLEIDMIRAEKEEIEKEADRLKAEKAKFETEWEVIDEKREELQKEAERVAEEKLAISKLLKDSRDSLKAEKNAIQEEYKQNLESLSRDRETFMYEIESERAEWFNKIQKERENFLQDVEMQKKELENRIEERREEIEIDLKEKEKAFEEHKKRELQDIASLRETLEKELEHVGLELNKLDAERKEINLDRERRDKEWAELNNAIEELKVQRLKLEKQRELLHADRKEILAQIEQLKKLEDVKIIPDRIATPKKLHSGLPSNELEPSAKRFLKYASVLGSGLDGNGNNGVSKGTSIMKENGNSSSTLSTPFSWLKRCADTLLDRTPSNKRRREDGDFISQLTENGASCPLPPTPDAPDVENLEVLPNQTHIAAEETTVYIDKIVTVHEVTEIDVRKVTEGSPGTLSGDSGRKVGNNGSLESDQNGKPEGRARRTRATRK